MIQFNKTIFQFTKRLALVVMLIGFSSAAWASNAKGYSRVEAKVTLNGTQDLTSEGSGNDAVYKAYVSTGNLTNGATEEHYKEDPKTVTPSRHIDVGLFEYDEFYWYNEDYSGASYTNTAVNKTTCYYETLGSEDRANNFVKNLEHKYYLYAEDLTDKYYFGGWYNTDNNALLSNDLSFECVIDAPTLEPTMGDDGKYVFTKYSLSAEARWYLPIVTKVTVDEEESKIDEDVLSVTRIIDNPNQTTYTENIVFTLEQDQAADNYKLTATNVPTGTIEYTKGQYKVPVNYIVTGQHGKETTYVITLTSEYDGGVDNAETFKTCSLTIKENYAPTFEITPNSYTFTKDVQSSNDTDNPVTFEITENTTALHSNTQWSWQIIGEDEAFFSMTPNETTEFVDHKPTDIIITFNRGESQKSRFEAKLAITCKYNSVASGEAPTYIQYVNLTATFEPTIQFAGKPAHSLDLGTIICGTPIAEEVDHAYYYLGDGVTPVLTKVSGNDEIGVAFAEGNTNKVNVTMANTVMPGTYTTTWKSTIPGDTDDNPNAELTVNARVELATPVLRAVPANAAVGLEWNEIYGATKYYITDEAPEFKLVDDGSYGTLTINGTKIDETTNAWYNHTGLSNQGLTYKYYVTAVYIKDGKVIDAKTSNLATARPDDIPQTITYDVADILELYTGTEKGGDNFPYKTKRRIDVRAAFDSDGNALMDRLYIYGLTTASDNGDVINYTNASTPCYIYERTNPTTYTLTTINAADRNVNTPNKLPGFAVTISDKLRNIYFTGYCPFATCGTTRWTDNAVMHIQGSGEVHVYIDNLQLYARSKDDEVYKLPAIAILSFGEQVTDGNFAYSGGSGAVFAFSANNTETPLTPYIHVYNSSNENILDATNGMKLTAGTDLTLNPAGPYAQYSSPIQILPIMIGTYDDNNIGINANVNLTITDEWNGEHTNGKLRLTETSGGTGNNSWKETNNVPSIDLGYAGNSINIAGGQLYLKQGTSSAMEYVSTSITGKVSTKNLSITLYGMQPTGFTTSTNGTVCFKDGTVNNVAGNTNALVCPANTTIDGGTFNCVIKAGSATEVYNSTEFAKETNKKALKRLDIVIPDKYIVDGKANIVNCNDFMDDIYPTANYDNGTIYASLSEYYTNNSTSYGLESLTPETGNVVHLYLFCDGTPTINPWVVTGQDFNVTYTTGSGSGEVEVKTEVHCTDQVNGKGANFGKTYNMLFVELDKYTKRSQDNAYNTNYAGAEVSVYTTDAKSIENTADYSITNKIYMMKPIVANDWMLFTAPFDVANVYVIEAYPERQLVNDFDGIRGAVHPDKVMDARKAQAERWLDLYMAWYNHGLLDTQDFFGATDGTYGDFVTQWMTYESKRVKAEDGTYEIVDEENQAYRPKIVPLVHYNGNNAMDAHYYLYQSNGAWTFANNNFTTSWTYVTTTEGVLMQQGKVYALQFPHNTIGGKHNPDESWDYWTGKYLLIESTSKTGETIDGKADVHTISGSDYAKDPESTEIPWLFDKGEYTPGKAMLCGNATFAQLTGITAPTGTSLWGISASEESFDVEIENEDGTPSGSTITRDVHEFVEKTGTDATTLAPAEGMIVANFQAPAGMRARSINYRTGEVTYEKIDDNNPGLGSGIPTIMGDLSLMVVPTAEGLTITPLKEQHVMLFDAEGKMIFSKYMSEEENVSLPTGVYVVRGEYEQVKAIKK